MSKVNVQPNRFLLTTPVVLLSCWGRDSEPNIITLAWTGVLCSEPPLVYASIRASRHSHSLLKANGDFVINLPSAEQARETDLCGVVSGRKEDKFALCGFSAEPAALVDAPIIAECRVHLECRTREVLHPGVHDVFIADVLGVLADEDIVEGDAVDDSKFAPLVYATGPRHYHRTEPLPGASYGFSKAKG